MIENLHTITGTLYAKDCRKVKNTKKPLEPDWEFYSIKVESKILISGRSITTIPELHLDKGLSYDDFEIGDPIIVDFYAFGKRINDTWFKTDLKAVSIKFNDIDNGNIRRSRTKIDTTFVAPDVTKENTSEIDEQLPF